MERVNHIDVVQVCGCGLVGKIYGMFKRQIPNRESLEFSVTGLYAALVVVIKLRKARSHLAAARARRRNNDERPRCFDIIVLAVACLAVNQRDI